MMIFFKIKITMTTILIFAIFGLAMYFLGKGLAILRNYFNDDL